jgi:hypothetical protein
MGYALLLISFSKPATETALDASEILILLCGLILAIGAVGEYIEEHGTLPGWMKWSRRPKMVFVWMVALSLVGEFVGDAGVFVFSGHLQTINDGEYAALNKEAGTARRDAGNANKEAGAARTEAANTALRAGKLEKEGATLRKQAEDERIQRLKLQERVAWRTISPAEIASASARLSAHKGVVIAIGTLADNEEAVSFAEDLATLIRVTGWRFLGVQPFGNFGEQRFGMRLTATGDVQTRSAAEDLTTELKRFGFDPVLDIGKAFDNGMPGIYLFVELRPRIVPVRSTAP